MQRQNLNVSLPIYRLDEYVLGDIFTMCVMMDVGRELDVQSFIDPWNIAAVSRHWRAVSLQTPTMWAKIAICILPQWVYDAHSFNERPPRSGDSRKGISNIDNVRRWVERSGTAALLYITVEIYGIDCELYRKNPSDVARSQARLALIQLVASLSDRMAHLELRAATSQLLGYRMAPIGDRFIRDVELSQLFSGAFPRLRSLSIQAQLHLHNMHIDLTTFKIGGLTSLRTLVLDDAAEFLHIFEFTSLESLTLTQKRGGAGRSESVHFVGSLVHFLSSSSGRSLRHLDITYFDYHSASEVFTLIKLPNLVTLRIREFLGLCRELPTLSTPLLADLRIEGNSSFSQSGKDSVITLLQNARFPLLRKLVLKYVNGDIDDALHYFLSLHPELTTLVLVDVTVTKTVTTLIIHALRPQTSASLCPRLRRLEIADPNRFGVSDVEVRQTARSHGNRFPYFNGKHQERNGKRSQTQTPEPKLEELIRLFKAHCANAALDESSTQEMGPVGRQLYLKWNGEETLL